MILDLITYNILIQTFNSLIGFGFEVSNIKIRHKGKILLFNDLSSFMSHVFLMNKAHVLDNIFTADVLKKFRGDLSRGYIQHEMFSLSNENLYSKGNIVELIGVHLSRRKEAYDIMRISNIKHIIVNRGDSVEAFRNIIMQTLDMYKEILLKVKDLSTLLPDNILNKLSNFDVDALELFAIYFNVMKYNTKSKLNDNILQKMYIKKEDLINYKTLTNSILIQKAAFKPEYENELIFDSESIGDDVYDGGSISAEGEEVSSNSSDVILK